MNYFSRWCKCKAKGYRLSGHITVWGFGIFPYSVNYSNSRINSLDRGITTLDSGWNLGPEIGYRYSVSLWVFSAHLRFEFRNYTSISTREFKFFKSLNLLCYFKMEYRHSPSYAIFTKVKKWHFWNALWIFSWGEGRAIETKLAEECCWVITQASG